MATELPALRRRRRVNIPGLVGRFLPHIATIDAQVEPYAQAWDRHNADELAAAMLDEAPLWVALGDSSTQGIGADAWNQGWVHTVRNRLRSLTGEPWRVVNLAMSGGRFLDVLDQQLPVLDNLLPTPDLVTCIIGSNDMMWRRGMEPALTEATRVAEALPEGTLLSRLGGPGKRPRAINSMFSRVGEERGLDLFSVWDWPGASGALAVDRIHPSNLGYDYMADLVWGALRPRFAT